MNTLLSRTHMRYNPKLYHKAFEPRLCFRESFILSMSFFLIVLDVTGHPNHPPLLYRAALLKSSSVAGRSSWKLIDQKLTKSPGCKINRQNYQANHFKDLFGSPASAFLFQPTWLQNEFLLIVFLSRWLWH